MSKTTITRNGQAVDCYGKLEEDSNIIVQTEKLEDAWYEGEWPNWTKAVEEITAWAKERGDTVLQLEAV